MPRGKAVDSVSAPDLAGPDGEGTDV